LAAMEVLFADAPPAPTLAPFDACGLDSALDADIRAACDTDFAVLISGSDAATRRIAATIYSARPPARRFTVIDCARSETEVLSQLITLRAEDFFAIGAAPGVRRRDGTLILRNVEALGPLGQRWVLRCTEECPLRIISTSSAWLFDRVSLGQFEPTLYYRLSAMHIIAGC
jgi:transcriptional regulator of acetoin/glycerol metabolism